mgnify:FL=1
MGPGAGVGLFTLGDTDTLAHVQATVFSHSPDATTVVTDAGRRLEVAAEVVAASGLRFVRPGQRVSITLRGDVVERLWITGIGEGETIT